MRNTLILFAFLLSFQSFAENEDTVIVSHESGWYTPFYLHARSQHGTVVYELDGTSTNSRSNVFEDSILVNQNMVIRFGVVSDGQVIFEETKVYLIDFETNFPILSLTTDPDNLYSSDRGIYVKGNYAHQDSSGYWINANYTKKWEREVFVNYLVPDKGEVISQRAGLRIFGGMTRHRAEKSLRIIARKAYGESSFDFPIFPYRKHKSYKHLVIRNSGGDANKTRFRDVLSTQLTKNLNVDIQEFQPVNLFMNGKFWGVYNLRERLGQHYLESNFGADKSESNLLQGLYTEDHGSNESYKELLSYVRSNDLSDDKVFDSVAKLIDIENFRNFQVAQIIISNSDYMGNIRFWQSDDVSSQYRWIMYDTDLGFGSSARVSFDFLSARLSPYQTMWYNRTWSTFLLRKLLENESFKDGFIHQVSYSFSTVFSTSNVHRLIDSLQTVYEPEMLRHFEMVRGNPITWKREVQKLRDFAEDRPAYMLEHTRKYFDLTSPVTLNVSINNLSHGEVYFNDNRVKASDFSGLYFADRPLYISSKPELLYRPNKPRVDNVLKEGHDSIAYQLSFDFVGYSPSHGKLKINEFGGLSGDLFSPWVELINYSNDTINLKNLCLISKEGSRVLEGDLPPNSVEVFQLLETDSLPILDSMLMPDRNFLYLIDDSGLMIDTIGWDRELGSIYGFYRNEPVKSGFSLLLDQGTPNEFNPGHLRELMLTARKRRISMACSMVAIFIVSILHCIFETVRLS